jgi:hypothetical protein
MKGQPAVKINNNNDKDNFSNQKCAQASLAHLVRHETTMDS